MRKSVTFASKPVQAAEKSPDEWVMNRGIEFTAPPPKQIVEPMKRLTIDVPTTLHTRMKSRCALNGVKMADEVRALLMRHFGDDLQEG